MSLLANENPYATNSVTTPLTGEVRVPQQEVLLTFQDWIWHKLITIFGIPKILPISSLVNTSQPPECREHAIDFQLAGLFNCIHECGPSYFDPDGQNPFSYVQSLIVVNHYEEAVLYLLQHHWLLQAVFLGMLLYVYGVLQGSQNVFVTALMRLCAHLKEKPDVMTYLIAFVEEPDVKVDLLVVSGGRRNNYDI